MADRADVGLKAEVRFAGAFPEFLKPLLTSRGWRLADMASPISSMESASDGAREERRGETPRLPAPLLAFIWVTTPRRISRCTLDSACTQLLEAVEAASKERMAQAYLLAVGEVSVELVQDLFTGYASIRAFHRLDTRGASEIALSKCLIEFCEDRIREAEHDWGKGFTELQKPPNNFREVGSLFRIPMPDDVGSEDALNLEPWRKAYRRGRFATFLTPRMEPVLRDFQRAVRSIQGLMPQVTWNPDRGFEYSVQVEGPRAGSKPRKLAHPFFTIPKGGVCKKSQARDFFDAIVYSRYRNPEDAEDPKKAGDLVAAWGDQVSIFNQLPDTYSLPLYMPHTLILGPSGAGKTVLARFLHEAYFGYNRFQDRHAREAADDLFVAINCGGFSEKLIASELFGSVIGSFTDSLANEPGAIFSGFLGTVFLDELGVLPEKAQASLLKYLDDFRYYPSGASGEPMFVPNLIIAATNRPLEELIEGNDFRRDLLARFRIHLEVPGLDKRAYAPEGQPLPKARGDFGPVIDVLLQNPDINPPRRVGGKCLRTVTHYQIELVEILRQRRWDGNFRELEEVLRRAVDMAVEEGSPYLLLRHLPERR